MNSYQAFKVLDINHEASQEEIKSAYRKKALELHPDKNKSDEDTEFKKITEAYQVLKNSKNEKRFKKSEKQPNSNFKRKHQWGAPDDGEIPQQDWGKYTKNFEDEDPSFWKEYEKQFWDDYNARVNPENKSSEDFEAESENEVQAFTDVDKSKCIGCCSCETIAPDVFEINKASMSNPKSSVINQKGASMSKIMSAAETCPTKAISVDNANTKERIFPH